MCSTLPHYLFLIYLCLESSAIPGRYSKSLLLAACQLSDLKVTVRFFNFAFPVVKICPGRVTGAAQRKQFGRAAIPGLERAVLKNIVGHVETLILALLILTTLLSLQLVLTENIYA